ncbi:MAG: TlyA family RNA methyltransferase [Coriobacteriia bacterium]|nr:TlyA family RNA methyltransferase [Coriobacteriia bacterium]
MAHKRRVDELLVAAGHYSDCAAAERALRAGEVRLADDQKTLLEKPGQMIDEDSAFLCHSPRRFVSRGGEKLAGALADFSYPATGLRCIDVDASTGGFTDCLLQAGAASVVALDVAYGIIDWKLRSDSRIQVVERCNIRTATTSELQALGAPFDLLVADLSFISLAAVFPALQRCVGLPGDSYPRGDCHANVTITPGVTVTRQTGEMILLVKPQFEAARAEVGAGGIVTEATVQRAVLERLEAVVVGAGAAVRGWSYSPIKGTKGNIEFWLWVGADSGAAPCDNRDSGSEVVKRAHERLD